ncbi:acyl-CoA dehydrogenase family protein [Dietzia lutea]|uniref:Acyl-CoA dehydrogenase n=1 Tax=Dietzia lutea TaxID=546160 RepID=A0A2S1R9Z2_9ACTN|nr:acyl-CoA dehydrogenase family protein [Dietzia lutea]AWH93075.1 hypothetical protein A6035_13855 [Dietzia lutea]AWH93095.1 hypothetical protein A6035_13970 [Dietzia lutea]
MLAELTEDQKEIRDLVRTVLATRPIGGTGELSLPEQARADWATLAEELGVGALLVPEDHDGLGLGFAEFCAILTECGRALSPAPVLSSGLATLAVQLSSCQTARNRWLPAFATGTIGALALAEDDDQWFATTPATRAELLNDDTWRLTGHRLFVQDAELADVIVVTAATTHGRGLFLARTDDPTVTITPMPTMDPSRGQATVHFDATTADRLDTHTPDLVDTLHDHALVALAAEQCGIAEHALDLSVTYARERHQFGRPIGSFQAVKHHCADILVDVERMRSITQHGIWAIQTTHPERTTIAAAAQAICSESAVTTTLTAIQIHGGIGFTWEHELHRYTRRAKTNETYLGQPATHRNRIADHITT